MPRIFPARSCDARLRGGFTLVESVVALAILALLLTSSAWTATVLLRADGHMDDQARAWLALEGYVNHRLAGVEAVEPPGFDADVLAPSGEDRAWVRITIRSNRGDVALASVCLLVNE